MRPISQTLTLVTPALNNVALDQTTAGAGSFTINGSLASGGTVTLSTAHRLDIESVGNISGVNFTITGTDENGNALSEVIAGPNATTVTTTGYFKTITSITVDGAVGTNTSIGTTDEAVGMWIPLDYIIVPFEVALAVEIGGTINFTVQHTFNKIQTETPVWWNHEVLTSATASDDGNYTFPATATKLVVNSFSSGATATFYVVQGHGGC